MTATDYQDINQALLGVWHVCIALVTIALGIGCTVRTAHFAHSRDNPQNFASINGYLGSGIWCGAVFLIIGIVTIKIVPLEEKYMTKRMARLQNSGLNILGFIIAGGLFAVSLHSAFLNDVRCPFDEYIQSVNKTSGYYYSEKSETRLVRSEECQHRNELVGLDAALMVIGLVQAITMGIGLIISASSSYCLEAFSESFCGLKIKAHHNSALSDLLIVLIWVLCITLMAFGTATTHQQSFLNFTSPNNWSLNGYIGTGIWAGAILLICSIGMCVPNYVTSIILGIVGVLDMLPVISLSIVSAFVTNTHCSFKEFVDHQSCVKRNILIGLDISTMVLGIIMLVLLSLHIHRTMKDFRK